MNHCINEACGKEIPTSRTSKLYCCDKCGRDYRNSQRPPKPLERRTCLRCGNDYAPTGHRQKYCPLCVVDAEKELRKAKSAPRKTKSAAVKCAGPNCNRTTQALNADGLCARCANRQREQARIDAVVEQAKQSGRIGHNLSGLDRGAHVGQYVGQHAVKVG